MAHEKTIKEIVPITLMNQETQELAQGFAMFWTFGGVYLVIPFWGVE